MSQLCKNMQNMSPDLWNPVWECYQNERWLSGYRHNIPPWTLFPWLRAKQQCGACYSSPSAPSNALTDLPNLTPPPRADHPIRRVPCKTSLSSAPRERFPETQHAIQQSWRCLHVQEYYIINQNLASYDSQHTNQNQFWACKHTLHVNVVNLWQQLTSLHSQKFIY